ncbi:MAG: 2-C-methyl-D-erythritol 4-phosphate cytidylyltransferase [Lachnospiraceae bacterium]|nr:2-C-methyl-D-erythritol 4-phosphate cytidylyltransferase [Lachnospiraceae bacterium]
MMRGVAVVVAGGAGSRMRVTEGGVRKQYLDLGGKPLMYYALAALEQSALIDGIAVVVRPGDEAHVRTEIVERFALSKVRAVVAGGAERYHSVYEGLRAARGISDEEAVVYIQDAARPFLTEEILWRCHDGVLRTGACVAAMPVKDTIKQADRDGVVTATPDRKTLWAMQTPQAFRFPLVYDAYTKLIAEESEGADLSFVTDDAMVVERYCNGQRILLTEGSYTNIKVTTPEDLQYACALLQAPERQ